MNKSNLAYLLGCIDPSTDCIEMTETDMKYYFNLEVQNVINKMKMLCFEYAIESIDEDTFEKKYNEILNNSNLDNIEKKYIYERKLKLLDMMLNRPNEEEKINDGKFHWGDEIKQKKLNKKEGIKYE